MKKIYVLFFILASSLLTLWLSDDKNKKRTKNSGDDINGWITGPRGERVFIGAGGGKYYSHEDRYTNSDYD